MVFRTKSSKRQFSSQISFLPNAKPATLSAPTQEYSVNLYLGSPSKVPIFAHGMGALDGVTLR